MTSDTTGWFRTKISELESGSPKKEDLLQDLKSFVLNSEKSTLSDIVHNVSTLPLFELLNASSSQEIDSICVVIHELLTQLESGELLKIYGTSIQNALQHESNEVKRTGLQLLEKSITNETIEYLMAKQSSLLISAADCLSSDERSTAQGAITTFIKMGTFPSGLKALYSNVLLKKLKEVMAVNDISRFRVYEIIVTVSKTSPDSLSAATTNGLMGSLVTEVHSTDTLVQLNALEILSNLANCNHGLNYLLECNVVQELVNKLLKIKEEPLNIMLLPGLIEFFGNVCMQQPENFASEYPEVIDLLFSSVDNGDQTLLGVIVRTVGKIGSTPSGRLILIQHSSGMNDFLKKMMQFLSSKNDLTINVLNSLCELFKKLDGTNSVNDVTEQWFDAMGWNALNAVVSLAKLPFPEFRISALSLLRAIATHQWGTKKLYQFAGMIEYLLDRNSESNKDCKQMKFDIVFNMVHSPRVEEMITPENMSTLKEFIQEGPFYIATEVELATEGAH